MARFRRIQVWSLLGAVVAIGLGGMLLVAALLKAADPPLFVEQIRGYKIFPSLASFGAYAFLWVEILLGLMLIFRLVPRAALLGFSALMLLFIGVTAWTWAHGNTSGCGCFGRLSSRSPRDVILEDGIYLLLGLFAYWKSPWIAGSRVRWMAFGLLLPVFLASPWIAPRLPVDSLITSMRPGVSLENLAADDLKVPLSEGRVFVGLLGSECDVCVRALPMMEALGQAPGAPRITGVFAGDRAAKRAWVLEHVPTFPLAHAPLKSLRQYYRRLPVFLLLEDGKIRRIWWDRVPTVEEVLGG